MALQKRGQAEIPLQYFLENEHQPLLGIFHWSANLAGSVYTDSTVVVPPEAVYSSLLVSRTHLIEPGIPAQFQAQLAGPGAGTRCLRLLWLPVAQQT